MADLSWLAQPPEEGECTVQFSSYDRATKLGPDGQLVNRFANGDAGHYQRVDRRPDGSQEFVLADAKGPGYVSRIWSANPSGELRVYVDGSEHPVIRADFAALTRGKVAPFLPPYGQETSRGCTLYFPLPFARSIKVVTDKGGMYFQVAVTTFARDRQVESVTAAVLERARSAMDRTRSALLDPKDGAALRTPETVVTVPPGESRLLFDDAKPGALSTIRLKLDAEDRDAALARCLFSAAFDGATHPQVAVPVGDYFGSGPGLNVHRSVPSEVRRDGVMVSRWYLPYARSAQFRLANPTSKPVTVRADFVPGALSADPAHLLRFHARWLYQDDIPTKGGDGTKEWPALRVAGGAGRFVGLLLNVYNPTSAWWGEGDEKIYVDGERFPSTIGTGTEDYFGYAWCDPHVYTHPFHAQSRCDGPGNRGYTSNVRYQVLDAVPFHTSLIFDMEIWHWQAVKVQYASIAYFYAAPGIADDGPLPDLKERVLHPPGEGVRHEPGVTEAETLRVLQCTAGEVPNQDMAGWGESWSGGAQLWWTGAGPGASLSLALPVEKAGSRTVTAAFTRAPDYGTVSVSIDGRPVGTAIDLYASRVEHSGAIDLGRIDLTPGEHVLKLTITGKNPKSSGTLVGVDWLRLKANR